jgi:hypothetical protein
MKNWKDGFSSLKKRVDDFLDVSAIEAGCFILDQQPAAGGVKTKCVTI